MLLLMRIIVLTVRYAEAITISHCFCQRCGISFTQCAKELSARSISSRQIASVVLKVLRHCLSGFVDMHYAFSLKINGHGGGWRARLEQGRPRSGRGISRRCDELDAC